MLKSVANSILYPKCRQLGPKPGLYILHSYGSLTPVTLGSKATGGIKSHRGVQDRRQLKWESNLEYMLSSILNGTILSQIVANTSRRGYASFRFKQGTLKFTKRIQIGSGNLTNRLNADDVKLGSPRPGILPKELQSAIAKKQRSSESSSEWRRRSLVSSCILIASYLTYVLLIPGPNYSILQPCRHVHVPHSASCTKFQPIPAPCSASKTASQDRASTGTSAGSQTTLPCLNRSESWESAPLAAARRSAPSKLQSTLISQNLWRFANNVQ